MTQIMQPVPALADSERACATAGGLVSAGLLNLEMEMKKYASIAVLWAALAVPAFACDKPSAPASIPNGKTAGMEDMMAAKKAVDAFKKDMEEYLSCEKSNTKLDTAQAELERVATRFNAEVRAFKAKS
ncbi:MAG TPA: hypothetical protein VN755_02500 [Steroidobacteraceae bacterium]|nr:hypothetical protein [Steroidobacteraceae bacterium]HXS29679.1 hypothetical protein [Steroidobacteraceae bacterium]